MPGRVGRGAVVLAVLAVLAAACGSSTSSSAPSSNEPGSGWPMYGRDLANTRANPHASAITRSSVARLAPTWSKDGLVGVVGTPAVDGATSYFADLTGTVWAVDTTTGRQIWTAKVTPGTIGGPALGNGLVYVASGSTLFALDHASGAIRWKAVTNTNPFAQLSASPVVVGNKVLIGTASFEVTIKSPTYSFQGSIAAYDALTGARLWNFVTTPNDATSGAGVGVWSTPAVDPQLGLAFFGTGQNLAPPPGPLKDSLLALDLDTGKLAWSYRGFSDDVFSAGYPHGHDYDFGASPNLFTAHGRLLVGDGEKSGVYVALDARTGKEVWRTTLAPGGSFGGALGSGAFVDGRLIVSANVGNASPEATKVFALDPADGRIEWTVDLAGNIDGPISAVRGVAFVGTYVGKASGKAYALDTATGAQLWSAATPGPVACGPAVVDGTVLWGYGFTLFSGPGPGGIIRFAPA